MWRLGGRDEGGFDQAGWILTPRPHMNCNRIGRWGACDCKFEHSKTMAIDWHGKGDMYMHFVSSMYRGHCLAASLERNAVS